MVLLETVSGCSKPSQINRDAGRDAVLVLPNVTSNPIIPIAIEQMMLVGCFGLNGPLRQYFSLYRAVSQREGERKKK